MLVLVSLPHFFLPRLSLPSPYLCLPFPWADISLIALSLPTPTRASVIMTHAGYTGPLCRRVTIGTLPDEAHREIFNFYVDQLEIEAENIEAWIILVHVCQRWRKVVFCISTSS